jgi:hypothetical protein
MRAGAEDLLVANTALTGANASIQVSSPAFGYNQPLPRRYTADAEGISPPLQWAGVPTDATTIVLLIEDADSPTPLPVVHGMVWDLPGVDGSLPEGALASTTAEPSSAAMGKNSLFRATYLPPDPPPGHGVHRYVFELFALDEMLRFDSPPGRHALARALSGHVIAKGLLIGTYARRGSE